EFQRNLPSAQAAAQALDSGKDLNKEAIRRVAEPVEHFKAMKEMGYALIIPPLDPKANRDNWQTAGASLLESAQVHPAVLQFAKMASACRQDNAAGFNQALADYQAWLTPNFAKELQKGRAEFYYNDVKAFLHATIIYITALVLACTAILTFTVAPSL